MNLIVLLIVIIAVWWIMTRVLGLRKYFGCGMCDDEADNWVCGGEARGFPDIYTEPCDASRIAGYNLPRGWNRMCSSLTETGAEGFCGAKKVSEGFCGDQKRQCGSQRCGGVENFSSVEYGRYGSPGYPQPINAVCGPVEDPGCQRPPTCDDCERPFRGYEIGNLQQIPMCLQEWKM